MVERDLPRAVELEFLRVVERELPDEADTVELCDSRPGAYVVSRRPTDADLIEHELSSAAVPDGLRPVRRRGRRNPRRPRAPSQDSVETESETMS
ncbi:hypothetical protein PC116_g26582 [Phytophthora cactorum]|nr:hypothetical protein Pcac1_g27954 [Phytophthora cactorum]KAG4224974.1 hypothetical protein PC116_g26582 [Phytophthora cactorum]